MPRLAGLAVLLLLGCSSESALQSLPEIKLPSLSRGSTSLASCPTEKCLIVYVAPWCPYCRSSTAMIKALREFLKDKGVATLVVTGMDRFETLRDYAEEFGPDTLIDAEGAVPVSGGVPHFFVSDKKGRIIKEVAGAPAEVKDVAQFASYFGLP